MQQKIDDYQCEETIGQGEYGKVKRASGPDGIEVALKVFDKSTPE